MKKIKLILSIILCIFFLGSCSCHKEVTDTQSAYGIVHSDYVGKVTVTVTSDKVAEITIDEAFLPHTWAVLDTNLATSEFVFEIEGTIYPLYIKIADEVLMASAYDATEAETAGTTKQMVKWSNEKIDNLYVYVKTDEHAKWYFEALKEGKAYPADEEGHKLTDFNLKSTKLFKSEGGYWEGEQYNLGWKGNIQELIKGMIANEFKKEPTKAEDGKISFGDVTTSATLIDYSDYYQLAKNAYKKIDK